MGEAGAGLAAGSSGELTAGLEAAAETCAGAGVGEEVEAGPGLEAAAGEEAEVPLPSGALGLVVISDSCCPSEMGPPGLAGQDPGGLGGVV